MTEEDRLALTRGTLHQDASSAEGQGQTQEGQGTLIACIEAALSIVEVASSAAEAQPALAKR